MNQYPEEILAVIEKGKDPDRVFKGYVKYPKDWMAQYNMLLADGVACKDCHHCDRCTTMFDQAETDTSCQFYPSRFLKKFTALLNQKEAK